MSLLDKYIQMTVSISTYNAEPFAGDLLPWELDKCCAWFLPDRSSDGERLALLPAARAEAPEDMDLLISDVLRKMAPAARGCRRAGSGSRGRSGLLWLAG